ncbi:MAG: LCP family protein [Dietzia sp.]
MFRSVSVVLGSMVIVVTLGFAAVLTVWHLGHNVDREVARIGSAFPSEAPRPPTEPEELTILLLGEDWHPDTERHGRTDGVMLVRVPAHRSSVMVVSIPRDSWVDLPGRGQGKINSALALGGPALAVSTVEELTRIRIDHLMMIDGDGFQSLTDALGGVTVHVPDTVHDSARDITWTAGPHHLDGAGALDYVGQRYGLPNGDLDRVRRHQNLLRALMADLIEETRSHDPITLFQLVDAVSDSIALDDEWSMDELRDLVLSLRYLEPSDLTFTTAPVSGPDQVGGQSVIRLDRDRGDELWTAIREDWGPDWVHQEKAALAGPVR